MAIIFEERKSRMGSKHLMSNEPFAVIRESGEIYLSGNYTIEELREILEAAEHNAHLTPETQPQSQAVINASALEQSDGDTPPAQAQVA